MFYKIGKQDTEVTDLFCRHLWGSDALIVQKDMMGIEQMTFGTCTPALEGQCHRDLVLFQNPNNVFGLTETVK